VPACWSPRLPTPVDFLSSSGWQPYSCY